MGFNRTDIRLRERRQWGTFDAEMISIIFEKNRDRPLTKTLKHPVMDSLCIVADQ